MKQEEKIKSTKKKLSSIKDIIIIMRFLQNITIFYLNYELLH